MPHKNRSHRVEAIVLRHSNWGEADRLLWLYTRELGKVRAVAKGARKPRSRKSGHLEPFTRASLLLSWGREIYIVTQAEAMDAHLALREDLLRIGYASYVIELLDRFTYEEGENPPLYRLLTETLARLDGEPDPEFAVRYYEMRLLDLVGFRPQLFHCANCETEILPQDQFFSADKGGVLCPRCGAGTPGVRPVSMFALKALRHLQRSNYPQARRLRLSLAVHRELENLAGHYLTYLLERNLNTPSFLRRLRSESNEKDVGL
jgi:DNA repair protein RecO (recombination protein O)